MGTNIEFHSKVITALSHHGYFAAPKDDFIKGLKLKRERVTETFLKLLRDKIAGEAALGARLFDCSVHYRHLPGSDGQIIILLKSSAYGAKPRKVIDFGV